MQRRRFLQNTATGIAAAVTGLGRASGLGPEPAKAASNAEPTAGGVELNVRAESFGAVGDGATKDTVALQAALDRCAVLGGGTVVVPAGNYLTGSLQLRSHTTLRLDEGAVIVGSPEMADYAVSQVRWEGRWIPGHVALVYAIDAVKVAIVGKGKIAGCDALGGRPTKTAPLRHPALIEFLRCDGVTLDGFSTSYHSMWSVHPTASRNIRISNLFIRSTGGNGDGIDIDSCSDVLIERCDIATGDDCISLKSGRGEEAYVLGLATENVVIRDCTFADSIFACIGIGSETSGGIRNVKIERCKFTGAKTFALYIKSRVGRGHSLENITAEDLDVSRMAGGFLRFNLTASGLLGEDPVPGLDGIPNAKGLVIRNVRVKDVPVLVDGMNVHPLKPLEGFTLENVTGTCAKGITLTHARHVVLKDIHVTGYAGPLLSIADVTGRGLEGAVTIEAAKAPEVVVAPAVAYKLQ
ncbi:Tat (twin-arginine translocation) pathway signal sequence [Bryocella elongata]|uniref:Tat (Twin-arginine translocation) pathway signal sequence n=1 Tax=Bryocella elongata TaxID=863522 RepID=A0A1H6BR20_9BACT|nr:glycoside hydrolase family 28 protein [Bryocella elongata]SEG62905.1 Tat (twin-arginine translocation) pathway signal sequence [Bryocella elongata]